MKKYYSILRLQMIYLLFLILGTSSNILHAEEFFASIFVSGIEQHTYFSTTDSTVHTDYTSYSSYYIGREGGTTHPYKVYRSYGTLTSLNLSPDAVIDNATLTISFNYSKENYSLKIVTLSSDPTNNGAETNWTSIGSGTEWVAAVTTAFTQSPSIPNLVSKLQALINNETPIYVGFKSNQESTDGTLNSFSVSIHGNYHLQGSTFYVKNSFNAGKLKVHSDTVNSGASFSWLNATPHPLEAIDQINPNDGYYYKWNTSGTSGSISKWQEKLQLLTLQHSEG